ncbi:MAG: M20/M25/M40 family metallo-hydrolase [Candidatus Dormibacteria bacterium]
MSTLTAAAPTDPRAWLRAHALSWLRALEELVRSESPSGDRQGLAACARVCQRLLAAEVGLEGAEVADLDGVPSLHAPASTDAAQRGVLLLGHLDTVWEHGSYQPPFALLEGRALGPGVFDMKGGVVVALAALAALRHLGQWSGPVSVLLTGDEEVGSASSRALIESEARRHRAVLVLEPPLGQAVKVARKGVGNYRLTVRGRAAHAGLDPDDGINSVVALAPLVARVAALGDPARGTSVSPTVIAGGARTNVIPDVAWLDVDCRFTAEAEARRVEAGLRALVPAVEGATLELAGGDNRPPLEEAASGALFALAQTVWSTLDANPLEGASVGGGSDGSFTAALGVPTLDGLGIVGGHAHAAGEWAQPDSIPDRAALLAGLLQAIWAGGLG